MRKELLADVLLSMRMNKGRIRLTGFSIAWGIFILILMIGAGRGLVNGMERIYGSNVNATVKVTTGTTSLPWNGYGKDRKIWIEEKDAALLGEKLAKYVEHAIPIKAMRNVEIACGKEHVMRTVNGTSTKFMEAMDARIVAGRSIDALDMNMARSVCVISLTTVKALLKTSRAEDAIGKTVKLADRPFTIVGVYKPTKQYVAQNDVFAPVTTITQLFVHYNRLTAIWLKMKKLKDCEENATFTSALKHILANARNFSPHDPSALLIFNMYDEYLVTMDTLHSIQSFVWIVGFATLLGGVVGVSNIMLITVKERTREFGVRKAIGAKPWHILRLILVESVITTAFFGYVGMFCGVAANAYMDATIGREVVDTGLFQATMFLDPTVGIDVCLQATFVIILAGTLAGLMPALKAARVRPIEALRRE